MTIQIRTYGHDVGAPAFFRSYAKTLGRRWGYKQAARHFASCHGSAVIHHGDDSATVMWRETGLGTFRVREKKHSAVRWI